MGEEKVLTMEIVEGYLENSYLLPLSPFPNFEEFTAIEDAAAERLSEHVSRRRRLMLTGLTSLSDAAAESLSKYEGALYLVGQPELSVQEKRLLADAGHLASLPYSQENPQCEKRSEFRSRDLWIGIVVNTLFWICVGLSLYLGFFLLGFFLLGFFLLALLRAFFTGILKEMGF